MTNYRASPGRCCACRREVLDLPSHYGQCDALKAALLPDTDACRSARATAHNQANPLQPRRKRARSTRAPNKPCYACGVGVRLPGLSYCRECRREREREQWGKKG